MNIAWRLSEMAEQRPNQIAVAAPESKNSTSDYRRETAAYRSVTFRQLDSESQRIAVGLYAMGVRPGHRIVLMVRPGIEFITLTFALFKVGAVVVLIDPGMGREHLIQCLEDVDPHGFVAIPAAQFARWVYSKRFPNARLNVTVGRRWLGPFSPWDGLTLDRVRHPKFDDFVTPNTQPDDHAAIIFTTGSTGPPKGVLYRHENFVTQVDELQSFYGIQAGEIDLPGFPLFALFNSAMGVTTVIPDMDPRKPAQVDPVRIVSAVNQWKVTQAFGSPAIWNRVGQHCEREGIRLATLRRILSAGAPVPPHVLQRMVDAMADDGEMHTPYGATESLPVASIGSREVLNSTAAETAKGKGTCVGRRFSKIDWRVIEIDDAPIERIEDAIELAPGRIGELIVKGPAITREYVTRTEVNALAKIRDKDGFWHRIGDVGYFDDQERFWFCGRKAHRLETVDGPMFTVPCEAIVNEHPSIYRSALVGIGASGAQQPVLIAEPWSEHFPTSDGEATKLCDEIHALAQASPLTHRIVRQHVLLHKSLPVDIRHNAKIFREKLRPWAEEVLRNQASG